MLLAMKLLSSGVSETLQESRPVISRSGTIQQLCQLMAQMAHPLFLPHRAQLRLWKVRVSNSVSHSRLSDFSRRRLILFLDRFWLTRGLVSGSCPLARRERLSPSRPMRLPKYAEERAYSPERTAGFGDRLKDAEWPEVGLASLGVIL